ncbi:MAG: hypothetical protein ACE5K4_06855 [Candidatus Hydrothermarchaeota archaeon]
MQLGLIIRLLARASVAYKKSNVTSEEIKKILNLLGRSSYTGHLKISDLNTNTWIIFRKGIIVEYFTVKKGCFEGDLMDLVMNLSDDEVLKPMEFEVDEKSEVVLYNPDDELNERIDYFLKKLSLGNNSIPVSKFLKDSGLERSREELLKKYRLKIPDEKLIDRLIESAGFSVKA